MTNPTWASRVHVFGYDGQTEAKTIADWLGAARLGPGPGPGPKRFAVCPARAVAEKRDGVKGVYLWK